MLAKTKIEGFQMFSQEQKEIILSEQFDPEIVSDRTYADYGL